MQCTRGARSSEDTGLCHENTYNQGREEPRFCNPFPSSLGVSRGEISLFALDSVSRRSRSQLGQRVVIELDLSDVAHLYPKVKNPATFTLARFECKQKCSQSYNLGHFLWAETKEH